MDHELYSTFFWSDEPQGFTEQVIWTFVYALRNPLCPVELVYEFGGLVNGLPVRIAPTQDYGNVQ
jgi:hypothetical protein